MQLVLQWKWYMLGEPKIALAEMLKKNHRRPASALPPLPLMLASKKTVLHKPSCPLLLKATLFPPYLLPSTYFFFNYLGDVSLNFLGFSRPEITTDPFNTKSPLPTLKS